MRTSLILAFLLVLAVVVPVQAKPPAHTITGGFGYYVVDDFGNRDSYRHISLVAQTNGSGTGHWTWQRPEGTLSGTVSCAIVLGSDAWIAGPRTTGDADWDAVFFYVHDGGLPSGRGDLTFGWAADPGETLGDMEALCNTMDTEFFGYDAFTVTSGNIAIQ